VEIFISSKFIRSSKRIPKKIKLKAKEKELIFRHNPFDPRLETHPLHGKYSGFWAFSINKVFRIMFKFENPSKNRVTFVNIGTHEIYR